MTNKPFEVLTGDCLSLMRSLPANSIDAVVTDPPYGLSFMNAEWDSQVPSVEYWAEVLRVAKPGAHLLAAGGTRTYHKLATAIEAAGWEIRDSISWLYSSGFPKSHDISKAIDKAAGAVRTEVGTSTAGCGNTTASIHKVEGFATSRTTTYALTAPATIEAKQWDGWGTALKPAVEPFVLARKPLTQTVAANVIGHGTGGLNIGSCRVGTTGGGWGGAQHSWFDGNTTRPPTTEQTGRWPANVIVDEGSAIDLGSNAKYFYCAKPSKKEKAAGLSTANTHTTVKPISLMRYLCRLVTPPNGLILDPFAGSGTTGCAARLEGFRFIGMELNEEYAAIARARIEHWQSEAK